MSATSHSPGETTCPPPRRDAPGLRHPHDRFHEAHPGAQLGDGLTGRLLDLGGGLISSSSRSMVRAKPTGAGSTMSDTTMTSTGSTSADAVSLTSPAGSTVTTRNPARIAALAAALARAEATDPTVRGLGGISGSGHPAIPTKSVCYLLCRS